MDILEQDITELKKLQETASRDNVKKLLSELVKDQESKLAKLKKAASDKESKPGLKLDDSTVVNEPAANAKDLSGITFSKLGKYSYDQGKAFVKIYCDLKDLYLSPDVDCTFTTDSFDFYAIGVPDGKGKLVNHRMKICDLCEDIDPSKSSLIRKEHKFVIRLQKKNQGVEWSGLDSTEKIKKAQHSKLADSGATTEELLANMYKNATDEQRADLSKAAFEGQTKRMNEAKGKN
eukprot:TRINITY_DN5434_c0_g1_i1.p1 TRINITY_DN5434_c0_g1~~TRINITY_DN5434_c0_g1_i1.p1  ORF type:complete len:251 (+),score=53.48 TRINITY_DN5434_c0_g1_i1:52-753(+)